MTSHAATLPRARRRRRRPPNPLERLAIFGCLLCVACWAVDAWGFLTDPPLWRFYYVFLAAVAAIGFRFMWSIARPALVRWIWGEDD